MLLRRKPQSTLHEKASEASKVNGNLPRVLVAMFTIVFAGFLLYITRPASGGLDTAAVALAGPLVTAVVVFYFHSEATAAGAAISAAGAAAGLAVAVGQPTSTQTGSTSVRTGAAA